MAESPSGGTAPRVPMVALSTKPSTADSFTLVMSRLGASSAFAAALIVASVFSLPAVTIG